MFKTLQPQGLKTYIGTDFHAEIVTYVSRKERTRSFLTKNHVKNGYKSNDLYPFYLIRILFYIGVTPAFWKKTTLRACKILYSFLANPITNENYGNILF